MFSNFNYHIITYGCQMNKADSERIAGLLSNAGGNSVDDPAKADIILLNTCSVRDHAEQRVYGKLGELKRYKNSRPGIKIGVCGCMAQKEGEALLARVPYVDMVVGPDNLHRIPELLPDGGIAVEEGNLPNVLPVQRENDLHAWVTVIRGCNNFCSYCIVPYVRGRERSRPAGVLLDEIKELADDGCREVTLLGQNVNSYGKDITNGCDFADLLAKINTIDGIKRIRFATSHPKDVSDRLIRAIADLPKVCEHMHLPVQAGDDDTLRRMGRGYTVADYKRLVDRIRAAIPNITLSTDVIAGFPGESESAFQSTVKLFKDIRYDQAFMFYYSPRTGTRAASLEEQLPLAVRKRRLAELIELQKSITCEINEAAAGKVEEVMIDRDNPSDADSMMGLTRGGKKVVVKGAAPGSRGSLVKVRLNQAYLWGFIGEPVEVLCNNR
ncbi:MAG: tRNA (N6-isopentenyl adenosine(37)-C2)-methylthiotransferase MiaB [bacterium]|nr:tRNA (N6-isopentenyl adenosine(37)-C2)-methylthiotransferase MiaB [bacterium]MDD4153451.1 tRNA (N6-isopentenyl adenosine(37)-C2)-methylthiotransferase MiaB [bacterium]MDD4558685.1 tRNA (N6-isopentenyl adenosine(37)-C2)-methylthiotransferase MiaB [bacterium]